MLLFTGVQTAHVYANNNSDTAFEFNFDGYSAEETSRRYKEWMRCDSVDGPDVGYWLMSMDMKIIIQMMVNVIVLVIYSIKIQRSI